MKYAGLICPLYAAMKERESCEEDGLPDAWAFALTQEEESSYESWVLNSMGSKYIGFFKINNTS